MGPQKRSARNPWSAFRRPVYAARAAVVPGTVNRAGTSCTKAERMSKLTAHDLEQAEHLAGVQLFLEHGRIAAAREP